jgi:hypothetical protein
MSFKKLLEKYPHRPHFPTYTRIPIQKILRITDRHRTPPWPLTVPDLTYFTLLLNPCLLPSLLKLTNTFGVQLLQIKLRCPFLCFPLIKKQIKFNLGHLLQKSSFFEWGKHLTVLICFTGLLHLG